MRGLLHVKHERPPLTPQIMTTVLTINGTNGKRNCLLRLTEVLCNSQESGKHINNTPSCKNKDYILSLNQRDGERFAFSSVPFVSFQITSAQVSTLSRTKETAINWRPFINRVQFHISLQGGRCYDLNVLSHYVSPSAIYWAQYLMFIYLTWYGLQWR